MRRHDFITCAQERAGRAAQEAHDRTIEAYRKRWWRWRFDASWRRLAAYDALQQRKAMYASALAYEAERLWKAVETVSTEHRK